MAEHPGQRPLPPGSREADDARRARVAEGGLPVSSKPSFDDAGTSGALPVDLIRRAARSEAAEGRREEVEPPAIPWTLVAERERSTDLGVAAAVR